MARKCNKPKRTKNSTWFKEKAMLAEDLELGVEIPTPAAFQTDDLDAFDSDYDDAPSTSVVLMAKFSSYDSEVLSDVPNHDNYLDNHVIDPNVQETQYSKQPIFNNDTDIDITSDSNMISYEQYLKETENMVVRDTSSSAQQDAMIISMIKEMTNQWVNQCKRCICLTQEITDMKEVFNQMETEVAKCSVERKTFDIKEKELLLESDRLLELLISQDLVHTAVNSLVEIIDYQSMENRFLNEYSECVELKAELSKKNEMVEKVVYDELSKRCTRMENRCIYLEIKMQQYKESFQNNQPQNNQVAPEFPVFFEINELKAQLQAKNNSISKLKDHIATLKGKGISECDKSKNISKVIAPGMYKIDLEPLSPKLLKNREARVDYLKHTQENADMLHEIVKKAIELRPLDSNLDSAFTPINKNKKVRFVEPSTSSSNTQKQVDSCKTKDSNKPLLPSTGVISSTNASRSKPPGNTKQNRISRPTSSNKKNKVEYHLRSIKPKLNKNNRISEPVCNKNVKHSVLNVNSELICATCNECMFDTIHDLCVLDYLNDVNVHFKSKSIKSKKKKV
ncbi:hypothetical protein Tco_0335588 [Tanacetum coccineum]